MIKSFYHLPEEGVKIIDGIADFDRLCAVENSVLWIDMCKPTDEESYILTHDFKFHPLAVEDVISEKSQTKTDDYERYLFTVFNIVDYIGREEGLKISELDLFLTKNTLVTVHYDEHRIFDFLHSRVQHGGRLVDRGADYLYHAVIDAVVDNYNATMDIFEYESDQIEEDILSDFDKDTLKSIFTLGRDIVELKRIVRPQRDVIQKLSRDKFSLISEGLQAYFSDIHDHLIRINELAETHREIINSSLQVYYSSVSTKTNEIIKVLTLLTAIFIPPTFLVGLWGMNFEKMPELGWEQGYFIALGVMLVIMLGMILFFKKKKWL
ncbi:MAG: magnesium and cobalt transport protein CorA [Candidatus Zixiibacteriota bacterium]|nr:MAG: magnesium and cobalt transport protein CorA [candidate division Zixibacteria bacterium]